MYAVGLRYLLRIKAEDFTNDVHRRWIPCDILRLPLYECSPSEYFVTSSSSTFQHNGTIPDQVTSFGSSVLVIGLIKSLSAPLPFPQTFDCSWGESSSVAIDKRVS